MNIDFLIKSALKDAVTDLFHSDDLELPIQPTNTEFEGSHTIVCFGAAKVSKKNPQETAQLIGDYLVKHTEVVAQYNVVKGFLNLVICDSFWLKQLLTISKDEHFGLVQNREKEIMVEFSSPNTNKPLHLGHLRNNFLGYSIAKLYRAAGYAVHKVQIINDRGIHICKSMAAWMMFGNGETPKSSNLKGDHLVGKYYVLFDQQYKSEIAEMLQRGIVQEEAEKQAPIMLKAVELLQKWEAMDDQVRSLWKNMNQWVYDGFDITYRQMGVDFDKLYYESETYLLGKQEVLAGLEKGIFYRKSDQSVWVDLTSEGLDHKLLLRSDGTSVYMTQDIGTAILRFRDFPNIEGQVYTVGNEQEHHFKVLFAILHKLGYAWAKKCVHLSYGMVDLPSGKMKSREGTVVDADDLMREVIQEAKSQTLTIGKSNDATEEEVRQLSEQIGLAAIKFFLLKVDPKKRMLFDPVESIKLQGHTGPFVQYTHARIKALLEKANDSTDDFDVNKVEGLQEVERDVIILLNKYPMIIQEAIRQHSPAVIANYSFDLAKNYNQFYQSIQILKEPNESVRKFRLMLSNLVAQVIAGSLDLLGIDAPNRM